jgi:hypothetical protein
VAGLLLPPVLAMTTNDFLQAFKEFLGRYGWPTEQSPWSVVEQWESLVDQVAEGYPWGLYEFANDLSVRHLLEKAFCDSGLQEFDQVDAIRERVRAADVRLKRMFLPGVEVSGADAPWWRRGVLASAGDEYRDDVKRLHGIEISR